jgi:hypothetical protein
VPSYLYDWPVWIAGLLIVVVFVTFALVSLLLVRRHFLPRVNLHGEHGQYGGVMIQSMVMLYGLVAALISVNVYNTYSGVSRIVSEEATSLASLYRDAGGYPEPTRSELRKTIRDYVDQIIHEAWPLQRHGHTPTHGIEMVNAIQDTLMSLEPVTESQKIIHAETLHAYNEMVLARRLRLDANKEALPGMMWTILILGAFICLIGSSFAPVDDARLHVLYQALLAALMGMILFMTFAWDRPYHGDFGITAQPYQLIYDQLMK